ncbi:MAG: hypothetical protein J7M29_00840 [Verrucomicrobia bacterium]|nr:hypothetical protein [Verrucomicrobiota bacterium]
MSILNPIRRKHSKPGSATLWLGWIAAILALAFTSRGEAAETKRTLPLQASLIWGTDGLKPADLKCRDVSPQLKARFRKIFRWKNYYEITRKRTVVREGKTSQLDMSKKCRLKIRFADARMLEVILIGEGRLVKKVRHPIAAFLRGELLVLAGDDKNNFQDAWFVVLSHPRKSKPKSSPARADQGR